MKPPAPAAVPAVAPPPAEPPRKRGGVAMPTWVAAIVILLIAGGLGYGAWWLIRPAPKIDLSQYESAPGGNRWAAGGRAGRGGNRPPNGGNGGRPFVMPPTAEAVVLSPTGTGTARVEGLQVNFTNANNKPGVRDLTPRVSDPNDNVAVAVRSFAINSPARRTAANVTDAQVAQLRQIAVPPVANLTPSQQATLLKLWDAVKTAKPEGRPATDKALLDGMKSIAEGRKQAAATVHAAADKIRAVLKPDQIATLQKPPAATTKKA